MGLRFRPVDSSFYDLLTASAEHLVTGASLLAQMLGDREHNAEVAAAMRDAEHAADETAHSLFKRATSSFVTPFDREDVYALGSALDDVMDHLDEAVEMILLYEVKVLPTQLSGQVEVLQRCAELTAASMPRLRTPAAMEEFWIEINRLENEGDRNHRRILAHLFSGEYKALEVLKLKDIAESMESAIDAFERVATIVEQIAVKET
ncbi:DUF47 family protein [Nocardioides sp. TRM66260-LWL]|uniref:DUF47 domain-containing protein n=1 Tax=Nocardioides sp. TRM66260-LWL TaxID=2874478 RepID=UPI001CC4E539|nr:DUF47 family protein [Nocardioides sp. TRM66260-LWL]MBZ5734874.1 DUF47 family protein [Nocardioides sp. TRM66260-LWL]